MVRQALWPDAGTRLLVVAPHPDDETLGCAELMQAVVAAGGEVEILLLTDGEANAWPQRWSERRWRIDGAARRRWAALRLGEMQAALRQLGLASVTVRRMGWPDLGVTAQAVDPAGRGWQQLATQIRAFAPSLVVCPDISDRHPDHGSAHVLVQLALCAIGPGAAPMLGYSLHGFPPAAGGWQLGAADARWAARKQAATECYVSQLQLSGRRFRSWVRRAEIYLEPPPGAVQVPASVPLPWHPGRLARLGGLVLTAVDQAGAQSWTWGQAPLVRSGPGHYDLVRQDRPWSAGPAYLRLALRHSGPWIFDAWGWWRINMHRADVHPSM